MPKRLFISILMGFVLPLSVRGQHISSCERLIEGDFQHEILSYLADDLCYGRECGSSGRDGAATYILDKFRGWELAPVNWKMIQSFRSNDTTVVRNIFGMVRADKPNRHYIIVSAHYDHIGTLRNIIYNGADDNASGVTVMMSLARIFSEMRIKGYAPSKNIIFIAFDGHEKNLCGSTYFLKNLSQLGISTDQIDCVINIDIIGTDLEPVGKRPEYIIALGESTLPAKYRGTLSSLAKMPSINMDLDLTFYGSRNFTKYVYDTGDQTVFNRKGIPAILFTSGFNRYTYKPSDDTSIINFELLRRRTLLIYKFIDTLCH